MSHAAPLAFGRCVLTLAFWRWLLVPLLSLGFFGQSHAAYANATAPAGWAGSSAQWTFNRTAANAAAYVSGKTAANVVINVGGRAVTVPAAIRLAANASSFAVNALRINPTVAVGVGVAAWLLPYGIKWVEGQGWMKSDDHNPGDQWETVPTAWPAGAPSSAAIQQCQGNYTNVYGPAQMSCKMFANYIGQGQTIGNGSCGVPSSTPGPGTCVQVRCTTCPGAAGGVFGMYGWTSKWFPGVLPTGQVRPITPAEWEVPAASPLPDDAANGLPWPLPVDLPAINPDPQALPQPISVPTGSPVPVPGTNPQEYTQPYVDVYPRPTPGEPWRVDLQPREWTGTDPNGLPDPQVVPTPAPTPTPVELEPWCGIPGKPDCTVKVNETGTPEQPAWNVTEKVEEIFAGEKAIAEDPTNNLPLFPELNWAFQFPTACAPIAVPAFSQFMDPIDVCQHQETFHDLMSMVWVVGGLIGAINMFMRNALATN